MRTYNTALALYFIGYVIFEVPSNIMCAPSSFEHVMGVANSISSLKRFDPQFWLPSLTLVWGIVSVCQGLVTNQAGLFGIRFLLGATEAGLFPGVIFLFSVYYRRRERSWRVAIFFGGAAVSGAFGGIFAYAIGKMDGVGGRRGWQWIFILEGLLTIVISIGAYFLVPTWLHSAKFVRRPNGILTEAERERLIARLKADSDAANEEKFQWVFVRRAWTDHLVWAYALLFHGFAFVLYSLSLFMVKGIFCVRIYVVTDGYIVLITTKTSGAQYVGVLLAAAGIYTGNSLLLSWPGENVSGQTKRAVAVAMQITIGDIGAISGSLIYRPAFADHRYRKPHIIAIGYLTFAIAVASYLWINLARENKRRDRIALQHSEGNEEGGAPVDNKEGDLHLGDRDLRYRYQL
ncbi:hypothetical protein HWV62_25190 [Athelia sp. TMB]|nr:hypothetical protein HWV62_25190 [Athelia sp. TMB]